jgi:hypothetical protein
VTRFAWALIGIGALVIIGLGWHGFGAYQSIAGIDAAARVQTPNPLFLFNDLTSTGIRVNSQIDPRQRSSYNDVLQQFVLDGTGVLIGIVLLGGGLFVRVVSDR